MNLNGTTENYIVISIQEDVERAVYVYEFSANDTPNIQSATTYDDVNIAKQTAELLNQISQLQNDARKFKVKKVTTIIEEVN